jgi:hypothetical protein
MTLLAVFYKQRELYFYPTWAYAISAAILKVPLSLMEAFVWTILIMSLVTTLSLEGEHQMQSENYQQIKCRMTVNWERGGGNCPPCPYVALPLTSIKKD